MNKILMVLGGIGLGAGLMYLLDPQGGRGRRSVIRDKAMSAATKTGGAIGSKSRDIANRAHGVITETRSAVGGALGRGGRGANEQAVH